MCYTELEKSSKMQRKVSGKHLQLHFYMKSLGEPVSSPLVGKQAVADREGTPLERKCNAKFPGKTRHCIFSETKFIQCSCTPSFDRCAPPSVCPHTCSSQGNSHLSTTYTSTGRDTTRKWCPGETRFRPEREATRDAQKNA